MNDYQKRITKLNIEIEKHRLKMEDLKAEKRLLEMDRRIHLWLSVSELHGVQLTDGVHFIVTPEINKFAKNMEWGNGFHKGFLVGQSIWTESIHATLDGKYRIRCTSETTGNMNTLEAPFPDDLIARAVISMKEMEKS